MTVPMWAAIASLIVACVRPIQHALENRTQPVRGSLFAAGNCSIPVTLVVLGAYFYTPPPSEGDEAVTRPIGNVLPTTNEHTNGAASPANGVMNRHPRREREYSSSEVSAMTLRDSIKEAFKMRGFKRPGSKRTQPNGQAPRKGETKTVFVAIVARMVLTPALILPAMAALAVFDLHKVMDEWVSFSYPFNLSVITYQ